MKNNRSLIITLIVVLSILVLGIFSLLIFLLTNGNALTNLSHWNVLSPSKELIFDSYYDNHFSSIEVENNLGDINLINSTDDRIHVVVYGDDDDKLTVTDNGTLEIIYNEKPCFGLCFNQRSSKIEISIPASYDKKIVIDNNAGDINIADFSLATFKITSDLGDTNVGTVKDADITNHAGDIEISSVNRIKAINNLGEVSINKVNEYAEIENDCGDIEIKEFNITENSKITNNLGDIEIHHTNKIRIDAKTKLGDNKINQNFYDSDIILEIEDNCGDIEVN